MEVTVRMLGPDDGPVLERIAEDVFDGPVIPEVAVEFLRDPRHHLAVAVADELVVGMASAVHYIHPDKPPELWVNEVGVAPAFQNRGIGRRLLATLFERGRAVGCLKAWLGTEKSNAAARRMYAAAGGMEDTEEFVTVSFRLDETPVTPRSGA